MLQQILKDMFIDPDILEELSDDQKQILFFKMREEQIRRWKVSEDELQEEEKVNPRSKKQSAKSVHFNHDQSDLNVMIEVIVEPDEDDVVKKQEEEALKRADERFRRESEEKRKELEAIETKRRAELKQKEEVERIRKEKEEAERIRKEKEEKKVEERRKAEQTQLQKQKEESEKAQVEEKNRIKEAERRREEEGRRKEEERRAQEENKLKIDLEKKKREEELAEQERKRREEIYKAMQLEEEEDRKRDEEEENRLEEEWKEREKKAKEADKQRRNSFSASKKEFERMRKLEKERAELAKLRKPEDAPNLKILKENEPPPSVAEHTTAKAATSTKSSKTSGSSSPKTRTLPAKRPPLPSRPDNLPRPTISMPVTVTSTRDEVDTIQIKKELIKPSRPPPAPSGAPEDDVTLKKDTRTSRPPRPKSKAEVIKWYKETEFGKLAGLNNEKKAMEWFHGVITRQESERLLSNKKQGSYLVRVSERVWGYTISYKDIGRCKHFLIDTIHGGYQFFGMDQLVHTSLNALVEHHKKNPISGLGKEILMYPSGQERAPADYEHLFVENTPI